MKNENWYNNRPLECFVVPCQKFPEPEIVVFKIFFMENNHIQSLSSHLSTCQTIPNQATNQ